MVPFSPKTKTLGCALFMIIYGVLSGLPKKVDDTIELFNYCGEYSITPHHIYNASYIVILWSLKIHNNYMSNDTEHCVDFSYRLMGGKKRFFLFL